MDLITPLATDPLADDAALDAEPHADSGVRVGGRGVATRTGSSRGSRSRKLCQGCCTSPSECRRLICLDWGDDWIDVTDHYYDYRTGRLHG